MDQKTDDRRHLTKKILDEYLKNKGTLKKYKKY
jgi:hypothetical protein